METQKILEERIRPIAKAIFPTKNNLQFLGYYVESLFFSLEDDEDLILVELKDDNEMEVNYYPIERSNCNENSC